MDQNKIAEEVYELARSSEPIAPLVKEALDVIDQTLDEFGCALRLRAPDTYTHERADQML